MSRRILLTFTVLAVSVVSFSLVQSMSIPVIAQIAEQFDTGSDTASWVLTAYLLSASVATPLAGRIGDAVGKGRILTISLLALSLGSLAAAFAPSIEWMIAARALQGLGGGVLPLSFGIIRDEFPEHRVAGAIGIVSSLMAVGMGLGIVVAGPILETFGFAWLFLLPCLVTGAAAIGAVFCVPRSPVHRPGRISVGPALLMAAWLSSVLVAVTQGPHWGWNSPAVLGLLALGTALSVAWVLAELRADVPVVDMRLMRHPPVFAGNLVALLVGMGAFASYGFFPLFNQSAPDLVGYGFAMSPTESGLMILPAAAATFVTGLIAAPIAARFGPKAVVLAGTLLAAVGMFSQAAFHDRIDQVLFSTALVGFGVGLVFACLAMLIVAAVPAHSTGVATGMNANLRTLGGAVGTAVMTSIIAAHTTAGLADELGYSRGFAVLGVLFVAAAVAALAIPGISGEQLEQELES